MDYETALQYLKAAQSAIGQAQSMLMVARTAEAGAASVVVPAATYVPAAGNPPTNAADMPAWIAFLADTPVSETAAAEGGSGYIVAYARENGVPAGQLHWIMQASGYYPPVLTHSQMLAAILQAVPYDKDVGCRWDLAKRQWIGPDGQPYGAVAVQDPLWAAVFERMRNRT